MKTKLFLRWLISEMEQEMKDVRSEVIDIPESKKALKNLQSC